MRSSIVRRSSGAFGGRPRVMHGPHDLKFPIDEQNDDGCTVFYPSGDVYYLPSVELVKRFYAEVLGRDPVVIKDRSGRTI